MKRRFWSALDGAPDLASLRSRLLDNLLLLMALAATPGILLSVLRARDIGWQTFMSVQLGILLVLWSLCLFRQRLSYPLRLGGFVVLSTVAAFAATLQIGPAADARFFLVLATLLLGLLLSARAAWAYVGFSVVAIAALGVYAVRVGLPISIDYPVYVRLPSAWFSITYTLAVYAGVFAYVAASLIQHLQRNAEVLERTSEVARIGTWELSASDELRWSPVVCAIHGCAEAPPSLQAWLSLCDRPDARERLLGAIEAARDHGEAFSVEVPARSEQGEPLWLRITGLALDRLRGPRSLQGLVQDITERREAERLKHEFVAVVSHELRTPLAAISGSLDLVHSGALGKLPERVIPLIDMARRNGERLKALVDDLLDVERLASGKLALQCSRQSLSELVRQALQTNQGYGSPRGIELRCDDDAGDAMVEVDPGRLQQVLANLISNAIKFSPDGGVVELRIRRHGSRLRTEVTDSGPGVPAAFRDRLFQPFSQADASDTRQRGGTGLGLAISRALVERMGGEIGVHSVPGQGATFWFDLPIAGDGAPA
jgi:signal transduction histidine kinase